MKPLIPSFTVALTILATAMAGLTLAWEQRIHSTLNARSSDNPAAPKSLSFQATKAASSAEVKTVVKGNNAFALDLYGQLRNQEGNLFFSPYSISTALTMTYAGARGQTATEMAKVLHFTLKQERLHPAFAKLMDKLDASEQQSYQLNIANRLWGQKGYGFLDDFLKTTRYYYGASLKEVDFAFSTEQSRRTINMWVEQKTQQKIQNLIPEDILNPNTKLVLTNAIYFKAAWASQFDPENTKNQPFSITPNQQVKVPMMYGNGSNFGYADLDNLQVLELFYDNGRSDVAPVLSMVILLPKTVDGLAELEQQLTPEKLEKWQKSLSYTEGNLEIWLPKFKVNSRVEMSQVLSKMGMNSAFIDGAADFSGINGNKDLFIFALIHKAYVDVNEQGTEAAAATAVISGTRGGEAGTFRADRPFLFLIRDNETGSILFLGRVVNPLASAATDEK